MMIRQVGNGKLWYHEKDLAQSPAAFAQHVVGIQRNDIAQREDERMHVFDVEIVRCHRIRD